MASVVIQLYLWGIDMSEHENIMHAVADSLIHYFEGTDAVNYIENTFECNDDPSKSFVLTMQIKDGLTPCQKLAEAESGNKALAFAIMEIQRIADYPPRDRAILKVIDGVIDEIKEYSK